MNKIDLNKILSQEKTINKDEENLRPQDYIQDPKRGELEYLEDDEEDFDVNIDDDPDEDASLSENIKDPYLKKRAKMLSDLKFREVAICGEKDLKNGQMI